MIKVLGSRTEPAPPACVAEVVADIEETTRSILKAVQDAERMAGAKVWKSTQEIAGDGTQAMTSKGIVAVAGDEIAKGDVDRANEVARAQAIPQDRELLHAIPQEYTVDKNTGIRDPIGMTGMRLETEMYLVTIGGSPAINLRKSVERAGYKVRELDFSSRWRARLRCSPRTRKSWASRSWRWERGRPTSPSSTRARSATWRRSPLAATTSRATSCTGLASPKPMRSDSRSDTDAPTSRWSIRPT